jgi:hypothetical protein
MICVRPIKEYLDQFEERFRTLFTCVKMKIELAIQRLRFQLLNLFPPMLAAELTFSDIKYVASPQSGQNTGQPFFKWSENFNYRV